MAKTEGVGVIGRPMSQEAAVVKLETVNCSNLWRQHQTQDSFDSACKKLLHAAYNTEQKFKQATLNELISQLGQHFENNPHETWRPPWKKKRIPVHNQTTMSPYARQNELSEMVDADVIAQAESELFEHPCVVTMVNKVLKAKFQEPGIEDLCKKFLPNSPIAEWKIDSDKVNSAYWSAVKTIKKRSHGGSPVLHNNPFDPRLAYRGVSQSFLFSKCEPATSGSESSTVNVFLTVPDVSSVLESYSQNYRAYCSQLTTTFQTYTALDAWGDMEGVDSIVQLPDEYEKLRCLWESAKASTPLHHTVRRPHPSRWQHQQLMASPTLPEQQIPHPDEDSDELSPISPTTSGSNVETSDQLSTSSSFILPLPSAAASSTPTSSSASSSSSSSYCSLSSSSEDFPLPTAAHHPQHQVPPSTVKRLVTRRVRRRLWDDNDLLLTSGRAADNDDSMDLFPLTPVSRSQSDPDLSRSFNEHVNMSTPVSKWGRAFDDMKKIELFPERQGESEAGDHVPVKRSVPKLPPISQPQPQQQPMDYQFSTPVRPHAVQPQPQHYQQVLGAPPFPAAVSMMKVPWDQRSDIMQQQQHPLMHQHQQLPPIRLPGMRPHGFVPPSIQNAFFPGYAMHQPRFGQIPAQMIHPPPAHQCAQNLTHAHMSEGHAQFSAPPLPHFPDFRHPPPSMQAHAQAAFPGQQHLGRPSNAADLQSIYSAHVPASPSNVIYSVAGGNSKPRASSSYGDLSGLDPTKPAFQPASQQRATTMNAAQSASVSYFSTPNNNFQPLMCPPGVPSQCQLAMTEQGNPSMPTEHFAQPLQNAKMQNRGFGGGSPFFPAYVPNQNYPLLVSPTKHLAGPIISQNNPPQFYQKPPQSFVVTQQFSQH